MKKFRKENLIELIKYIIFGVLTTLVGLGTFMLFEWLLGKNLYLLNNALSWVIAVAFAFVTNKLWVFNSKSWQSKIVLKEAASFAGARLFSLGVEELGLWLLISVLGMGNMEDWVLLGVHISGDLIAKGIMMVIIVILNYVLSKFIIFKKKEEKQ
ncbi:MAG: GtrA family protein [Ruminococcaceae bacterium]|nr:GtrA family protein [Oscillospiraceae bacterium]